jgi:hypothetical protein
MLKPRWHAHVCDAEIRKMRAQVLVSMVGAASDEELQLTALGTMEMLAETPANVHTLLAAGALDWFRALLFAESDDGVAAAGSPKPKELNAAVARSARHIVGKLVVGGLVGDARLLKLKELCDHEELHALVTEQVMPRLCVCVCGRMFGVLCVCVYAYIHLSLSHSDGIFFL